MGTGIKQKVTKDQWENDRKRIVDSLDDTMRVQFELAQGRPVTIIVEHWKETRSNEQNKYMWEMVTQIGRHLGSDDKRLTLDFLLDECFGQHYADVAGKQVMRRPRTSKFTKAQMVKFISWCIAWSDQNAGPVMMAPEWEQYAREAK